MNKPKKSRLSKLQFHISGRVTYLSETACLVPLANITNYSTSKSLTKSIRVMREQKTFITSQQINISTCVVRVIN